MTLFSISNTVGGSRAPGRAMSIRTTNPNMSSTMIERSSQTEDQENRRDFIISLNFLTGSVYRARRPMKLIHVIKSHPVSPGGGWGNGRACKNGLRRAHLLTLDLFRKLRQGKRVACQGSPQIWINLCFRLFSIKARALTQFCRSRHGRLPRQHAQPRNQ